MSKYYIIFLGFFWVTSLLQAQTTTTLTDSLELENIVVTASKIPVTERETNKPVIVIERKEIEQSGLDLSQLLDRQSGLRINQAYGAPAENKSVYLQGAGGEYALILVDGLAIADPSGTGGAFDIRQFPLSNVERIEIIKGSQSTLYGTDAISGVINIITKSGTGKPFNATGQLSYGSFNTLKGDIGVHGELNSSFNYSLNYSSETSDGISAAKKPGDSGTFENDGLKRDSFNGKITLKPVHSVTLTPSLTYSVFEGDYDEAAFADAANTFRMDMLNPGLQVEVAQANWSLHGGYNYTRTDRLFSSEEWGNSEFEGRLHNADLYGVHQLHDFVQLLAGINYQHSRLPGDESISAEALSPYATLVLKNLHGLSAELGYRLNRHSVYGKNSTVSFAPSFALSESVKIYAGIGTGFKVPTLDELFGPFGANEDLNPQTSTYYNAGFELYFFENALKTDLQFFNRRINDVIVYTASGYLNRDRQNTSGVEVSGNWLLTPYLTLGLNYNYLKGEIYIEEEGNRRTENNLIRRPAHSLGGHLDLQLTEQFFLSVNSRYSGERKDLFYNPDTFEQEEVTLDPYTLLNVHTEYSFKKPAVTVFCDIKNLLNTDFTEVYGFNTIGFSVTGGIRFLL